MCKVKVIIVLLLQTARIHFLTIITMEILIILIFMFLYAHSPIQPLKLILTKGNILTINELKIYRFFSFFPKLRIFCIYNDIVLLLFFNSKVIDDYLYQLKLIFNSSSQTCTITGRWAFCL
jgi:hypothetical protein